MTGTTNRFSEEQIEYTILTLARTLICLAIPLYFMGNKMLEKLKRVGWKIEKEMNSIEMLLHEIIKRILDSK